MMFMINPKVKGGCHEMRVNWPPSSEEITDMFIGRFDGDGEYHLLGHRPRDMAYMFPANDEIQGDIGVVCLPDKKKHLGELVEGDVFEVVPEEGEVIPAKYIEMA